MVENRIFLSDFMNMVICVICFITDIRLVAILEV